APTVRLAELTTTLRFAGGLHFIAGRVAVEAEVDAEVLAKRIARDLVELFGVRPDIVTMNPSPAGENPRYAVRVIADGETLARQLGLLDQRRKPIRGLPNRLTTGSVEELAGLWRGAFLASGSLGEPGRSAVLEVVSPTGEAA